MTASQRRAEGQKEPGMRTMVGLVVEGGMVIRYGGRTLEGLWSRSISSTVYG